VHERIFETVRHSPTHGGSRARGSFDDTSICVPRGIDLHVEVDLVVHPGSMMLQGYTGDYLSMQEHTVVSDDSQRHAEVYSEIQRGVLMCREETHFGEHVDASPLQQPIAMRDHLRSISSCMGDETWRVVRPKPPDMSAFTAYNRTEVGRDGQTVEALCVMMSIIGQMIADNSEVDTDTDTHEDEHGGLPTVISLTQEQPTETGSDKLPSLPWDLGVHFVSRMFHYLMTQVAPESHILHLGLVWSGPAGTYPMERGSFSILIIMIGHGDGWTGTSSTEVSLQIQFLDNRSGGHRYFSSRIQERRVQYVCRG
jgi:hypothetical protein